MHARAVHQHSAIIRPFDTNPHGAESGHGRERVFALKKAADPGVADSQCAEHHRTVGNRFVARHPDLTAD